MADVDKKSLLQADAGVDAKENGIDVSWFPGFLTANFAVWVVLAGYTGKMTVESNWQASVRYNRGPIADQWYLICTVAFAISAIFALMGIANPNRSWPKKTLDIAMFTIQFVVASTWCIQYLRLTPSFVAPDGKVLVDPSRFLEWSHDQAATAAMIAVATGTTEDPTMAIVDSYIYTALGFAGTLVPHPYSELCWVFAFMFFVRHTIAVGRWFTAAQDGKTSTLLGPQGLVALKWVFVIGYWGIALAAYFQRMKILNFGLGEIGIGLSEMFIKIGMTMVLRSF